MSSRYRAALASGPAVGSLCLVVLLAACTQGGGDESNPCPPDNKAAVEGSKGAPEAMTTPGRFAYHDIEGSLWTVGGDGEGRRRLTDPPDGAFDFDPDWAPDGRRLVYRRDFEGPNGAVERSEVRVVGMDCRDSLVGPGAFPGRSPDGRVIALTAEKGIVTIRPDGSGERVLDASGECDTWSLDGRRMAYCSNDFDSPQSDDWDVIVMRTDGSEKRQLTHDPGRDYPYSWSPDASQIAFTSEQDGANRAWVMNADGTDRRRLTGLDSDYETVVMWLPDGDLLLAVDSPADGLRGLVSHKPLRRSARPGRRSSRGDLLRRGSGRVLESAAPLTGSPATGKSMEHSGSVVTSKEQTKKTEVSTLRARVPLLIGTILLMSSCVSGGGLSLRAPTAFIAGGLQSFSSCDEFLEYVKGHALERVTPYGLPGGLWGFPFAAEEGAVESLDQAAGAVPAVPAPAPGTTYSTTNVQTAGVDEPDIVKTDGDRVLALAQGKLFLVDITGSAPELQGSLSLPDVWVRDLLLLGDRALLLGESNGGGVVPRPLSPDIAPSGYGGPIAALLEVDLSDPDQLRISRRLLLDGRYLSARMIDGVVRVVVSSYPTGLPFVTPEGPGLRAERKALELNREVTRESKIENWVPYFVLEDAGGETVAEGSLLDCASSHHPEEFSGFGMLTVVTLDLSEGLGGGITERSVGVLSDGETVYASADSLYVATQRWMDWQVLEEADRAEAAEGHVTQIHRFDISGSDRARYRASGEVTGWLLNQFSMDEFEGNLRVASTDSPPFWDTQSSESMVTVLSERDGRLVEVGRVGGLGKGEHIQAVRFLGDLGYVVTFRQVDPLYVVDLSDPARPDVAGELKILGYSAYLHPLGNDQLLGVGQDATKQGSVKGTQLSVFDVSDPSSPSRIDRVQVSGGSSEVEWDHHAFLYWEPEGLVVLPVNDYGSIEGPVKEEPFLGALAVRVQAGALDVAGRLSHDDGQTADWGYGIRRSLVVGDLLYTIAETGVEAVDLTTLTDVASVPFR